MKALENNNLSQHNVNIENIHFLNPDLAQDIHIVDHHEMAEKGQLVISLYSPLFSHNQIKVFIRGNKIVLFITEKVEADQSAALYISDWQNFYPRSYFRMRNVSLLLPGDNFYLLRHVLIPDELMLKIVLGKAATEQN